MFDERLLRESPPRDHNQVDADVATRVEAATGQRLPPVRVSEGGAAATAHGREIALGNARAGGSLTREIVLAHELAHAAEQTGGSSPLPTAEAEAQADRVAVAAVTRSGPVPGFRRGGLALRRCGDSAGAALQRQLDAGGWMSAGDARKALARYRTLSASERTTFFNRYYPSGAVTRFIQSVDPADAAGAYRNEVNDILRRIQEAASEAGAGLNQAGMVQAQADWMRARDETAARAAAVIPAAPTSAEVEQAHRAEVEARSSIRPPPPVSRWAGLTAADQASWTTRGNAAIARFVTFAAARHPELNVTAAEIVLDFHGVEMEGGANAQAFTRDDASGRPQAHVGFAWVELVEADPAYGTSIIVHELRGHPQYEPMSSTFPYSLYRRAATKAGYPVPAAGSAAETQDIRTFGYEDTEMYSLLRSAPYHTPVRNVHAALRPTEIDPESTVRWHVTQIRAQWEPRVANGILAGFYRRIVADPRITAAAVAMYRRAVIAEVPAAESAVILR